jgi:hypothetical protein
MIYYKGNCYNESSQISSHVYVLSWPSASDHGDPGSIPGKSRGICGEQCVIGEDSPPSTSGIPLPIIIPSKLHSLMHHASSGVGTIGPLVAQVRRGMASHRHSNKTERKISCGFWEDSYDVRQKSALKLSRRIRPAYNPISSLDGK